MRLLHPVMSKPIHWRENRIPVLILESPKTFRNVVLELSRQAGGETGDVVLSLNYEELDCGEHLHIIRDYVHLPIDDRKLQNQFQKLLHLTVREELSEATDKLHLEISKYLQELSLCMEYPISYSEGEAVWMLLKALKFQPVLDGNNTLEKLIQYMELYNGLMKNQCFILVNASAYFEDNELLDLYRMVNYRKWNILILEQTQKTKLSSEEIYLIDRDCCELRLDIEA